MICNCGYPKTGCLGISGESLRSQTCVLAHRQASCLNIVLKRQEKTSKLKKPKIKKPKSAK